MGKTFRIACALLSAAVLAGCSTWRCRGFLDANTTPGESPKHVYRIEGVDGGGIDFRHLSSADVEERKKAPRLAWLSEQDTLVGTTYLDDIAQELGMTNAVPGATRIRIAVVPVEETRLGRSSLAWPMCCTLGVIPAHLVDEASFDVIVQFIEDNPSHVYSTAQIGQVRVDYQCGLSRLDMDTPPLAVSATSEIRDDGTIGTGRGLRPQRLREVFVKTVAAAVRRAIAVREGEKFEQIAQPSTEFGPVQFASPIMDERSNTPGWGASPQYVPPAPKTLEDFLKECWNTPKSEEAKKLKRLVDIGMLSKDEWKRQTVDRWNKSKGAGGAR